MPRNLFPALRTLAATAAAVAAIACADRAGPTDAELAARDAGANAGGGDSAACDLTISGRIYRFAGTGDSASDTLGRRVPLAGARVEAFLLAPLPGDSVPPDTIPNDTIPNDSTPPDSTGGWDTLWLRSAAMASAGLRRAPGDTIGGSEPVRVANTASGGDGSYALRGLCPGIYRIEVTEPGGTGRSMWTILVVRADLSQDFAFPPRR